MSEKMKVFWLGIFIIACVGIVAWLLLFLRPAIGDGGKTLRVRFTTIEKVALGTRVTFAGKTVGEVVGICEIPDARSQPTDGKNAFYFFQLALKVDSGVQVYSYDQILFATDGLLGEKTIAIVPHVTPSGCPPAREITDEILYGHSTTQLEDVVGEMLAVSETFSTAMQHMSTFFEKNTDEFHGAIQSLREIAEKLNERDVSGKLTAALEKTSSLLDQAHHTRLLENMSAALLNLGSISGSLATGEGSLGRLLHEDTIYFRLNGFLGRFETLLDTLNNYGIFYQFDSNWRQQRRLRQCRLDALRTPCDYYTYLQKEAQHISHSLDRVNCAIQKMECAGVPLDNPCVGEQFRELECQLNLYNESFMPEYCH